MKILLVHLKLRNMQIMMTCQMMNRNKILLWKMSKMMSFPGDHSVNRDRPSSMIIWYICMKTLMTLG
jgi:hypothetical protein